MGRKVKKYEKGKGGKKLVVDLDEEQFRVISKDIEDIEIVIKKQFGTSNQKMAVIRAIKHYAKHARDGDFEE